MKDLLNLAINVLGTSHKVTIEISQLLDKEIYEQQIKLNELKDARKLMVEELKNPSEQQKIFEEAYKRCMNE